MEKPFAITLDPGSSRADKTGSWRTERAVYTTRQAPCGNSCPAGEDVRSWLYEAEEGGEGYVFPGQGQGHPLSNMAMLKLLGRMGRR